jgi:GNAT superfamily N-acetyltransferase
MEVRLATATEVPQLSRVLARAFDDDPVSCHLLPPTVRRREDRLARFMGLSVKGSVRLGCAWTTATLDGAALWRPPGRWRVPAGEVLLGTPTLLRALGTRARAALAILRVIEDRHPSAPHWYLEVLGTEPARQGRGIGGAMMAPMLERCDAEGVPAYLESSKERNLPYYERYGFRVTGELTLPKSGPTVWLMWREPQA